MILAGEKSFRQNAVQSSYEYFKKATEIFENENILLKSQLKIRLYRGWASANLGIGSIANAVKCHKKVLNLCQSHGLPKFERKSLLELAFAMNIWPDREDATSFLNDAVHRARILGDKALESLMLAWAGISESCFGSLVKGKSLILAAEKIVADVKDPLTLIGARMMRSFPERWLGNPGKTIKLTESMVELIQKSFDFTALCNLLWNRAVALAEMGRIEESISLLKRGIGISEKYGPFFKHASFLNCLGYAYGEIQQAEVAWNFNMKSDETAREFLEKYPEGRLQYAEIAAQARINLMENLFELGRTDESWSLFKDFEAESRSEDYNMVRCVWETRMYYLASQILIEKGDLDQAENLISNNLAEVKKIGLQKREGSFLRLLGEVQTRRNELDHAIDSFNNAILRLEAVGNPRKIWESHAALASAYNKLGRNADAREHWGAAARVIEKQANGLLDLAVRESFLKAEPIQEILTRSDR